MAKHRYVLNSKFGTIDDIINAYMNDGLKLDIGCGFYKPVGYIGIDNLEGAATQIENQNNLPDIFMDLNKDSIPFEDNSIDEIRSSHFLEHSNLDHIFAESYRVLKSDGVFLFTVPYANSAEGLYPGHNIFLTEKWFYNNIGFQEKFEIIKEKYDASEDYRASIIRFLIPFRIARKFLFNSCWQMTITCRVKK